MAKIYSDRNKIKLTDITERYAIPKRSKATVSQAHSALITYAISHFQNTRKFKQRVVDALNIITYCVFEKEAPSFDWKVDDPLSTISKYDMDLVEDSLGDYMLAIDSIDWNVDPVIDTMPSAILEKGNKSEVATVLASTATPAYTKSVSTHSNSAAKSTKHLESLTPKEDLYIQSPKYPQFDHSKIWLSASSGDTQLCIYTTLPEIPVKQNQISVTTDLSAMTDSELMNLFPNHIIHTRGPMLYEHIEGLKYDKDLGNIFPIEGFTECEVVDNIIKYPHLYKLKRNLGDNVFKSFYEDIEIDGKLISIAQIWDSLPEAEVIPKHSDFIKEYVVRRYLLERDSGINHKYPLFGKLDPYLTLFMPPEDYITRGYRDTLSIVKQCVSSRIAYKQSRNPILRRLNIDV